MTITKLYKYLLLTLLLVCFVPFVCSAQKATVDLIYETDSYVPPFYKGKALNPNQGLVLVTAIPELINSRGEKISSGNTLFIWKKNDLVVQNYSGKGKNVLVFRGTVPIRDTQIEVTATSLDGSLSASKQITIPNISPKIIFYENNPVYGIMFNRAITNAVNLVTDEFNTLAMPYFFSATTADSPDLKYTWMINNRSIDNELAKNSFSTRVNNPGSGTAKIDLRISNNLLIFQFLNSSYNISFTKK